MFLTKWKKDLNLNLDNMHAVEVMKRAAVVIETQRELIEVLESQVADLTMMSKIELGDDVIAEILRLKTILNENETEN
jgi:hypothetical protein